MMKINKFLGYTVTYEDESGETGFIGIDDHSGGYLYLSGSIENRNVFDNKGDAVKLKERIKKELSSHFNSNSINWNTLRVVTLSRVLEDVKIDKTEIMKETILSKLSDDEIKFLTREWEK